MSKTITLRLPDEVYDMFRQAAEAQRRPISNLIETAALENIRNGLFADDAEMAEILEDESLVKRLKKGSKDAHHRRGRFVE